MKVPYLQTWYYVCRLRKPYPKIYKFIQRLCAKATGHDWSLTEYGYGGGDMFDRWCRWCNYRIKVPTSEEPSYSFLIDRLERKK